MFGQLSEDMRFNIGYADRLAGLLAVPEKPVPEGYRAG
jgi:hypothetical protein